MAGTERAGVLLAINVVAGSFFNQTSGIGPPFKQRATGNKPASAAVSFLIPGGSTVAGGGSGLTKPPPTLHVANDNIDAYGLGRIWFDKVHILPKKFDFGLIITQEENLYEIYNAHRTIGVALGLITNSANPGIAIPDTVIPLTIEPQTSHLRNTSTSNDGGTTLGTLVLLRVQALEEGLSIFNGSIVYDFSINSVALQVAGFRIVLIPFKYDFEPSVIDTMEFLTDIIQATKGKEQRISLRESTPRQLVEMNYKLVTTERQYMRSLLFDGQGQVFGVPLWHEEIQLAAAVTAGATNYPVTGVDDVDMRVGGLAVVISDNFTFDVLNLSSVADTLLVAADPSINGYAAGTPILPLRTAVLTGNVPTRRELTVQETFRLRFTMTDSVTGALVGSTTPGFWSTYKGKVLFDNCNVVPGGGPSTFDLDADVVAINSAAGAVDVNALFDTNQESSPRGFMLHNRSEIIAFKKLLIALNGRQTAFYTVTDAEDLTPAAALVATAFTIDIVFISYTKSVQSRQGMDEFRITFTDGTSLERDIISSVEVSPSVERLTLDVAWPVNRTTSEIVRVEFIYLARFDNDRFHFRYQQTGRARVKASVVRVFDA